MRWQIRTIERPRDCLPDRPATRSIAVEPQLIGEALKAADDGFPAVPELERARDRGEPELALADERLWVDHEPWLSLSGEHVFAVQVLVQQHLFSLRRRQRLERINRRVEETPL